MTGILDHVRFGACNLSRPVQYSTKRLPILIELSQFSLDAIYLLMSCNWHVEKQNFLKYCVVNKNKIIFLQHYHV